MKTMRVLAWTAGAAMLAGCASGGAGGATEVEPEPLPDAAIAAAAEASDPAAALLETCASASRERAMDCYQTGLVGLLERDGVAEAMATAERMGELDTEFRRDGHVYAHAIGLAAYTDAEDVGRVFASCTESYQSGCFHGVIQSYFSDVAGGGSVESGTVNALCADQRGGAGSSWLLFQCAHGIGHGVTMVSGGDLRDGLAACDLLDSAWEQSACYGGAFMENVVQATMPHHSVGRPEMPAESQEVAAGEAGMEEHAGHAGMSHGGGMEMGGDDDFAPLDPDDPLYPCTVLDDRYLPSCYLMQTSAILYFNGGDLEATADACRSAPGPYRTVCFQSLGRDVSARTVQDHTQALAECEAAGEFRDECHVGYVKNVIDVTADPADGVEFCRVVPDEEGRTRCYRAVGEQVRVLADDLTARVRLCTAAGAEYAAVCRAAAGVPERASDR